MATFAWTLQGSTPTTIGATDKIKFAGATFSSSVLVDTYQTTTHVASSAGADLSTGNSPHNSKFISASGGTGGDSQVDIGGGSVDLDTITTAQCPLKINFSDATSVITEDASFYAYDGSTPATQQTDVTCVVAEQGDANWVDTAGSATPLALADQSTATSHDFFILISAKPLSVGLKTAFAFRIELTYA